MTAPHNNEWDIKALQARYKAMIGIELSTAQAERVLIYEEEKSSGSSKYFFSTWEELDYEQVMFREILTAAQFESYMSDRVAQLNQIEESLIETDKEYLPQLNAAEERLVYYRDILIPSLRENLLTYFIAFNREKEKVDFLKSMYRKFLTDTKKQILVDHFRHSKTFQPILLKLSLLRHQQMCLFPDYFSFKGTFDTATKAVAEFLQEKLSGISENLSDTLKQTIDDLKEFNTNNTAKHIGEVRGCYTTIPVRNKTEELMFIFLFDPDKK